jgi:transposase
MRALRASDLVPAGFTVEKVEFDPERVAVSIRATEASCPCPLCGATARRVHSRYLRKVADLPVAGRLTEIALLARRFFCDESACHAEFSPNGSVGL